MDQQTFQRAIVLLSGEHSLSILRSLRDADWHLSSEVARSLDIHITTASKFLQRFAELGLVERRQHDVRTFEYCLRSPRLRFGRKCKSSRVVWQPHRPSRRFAPVLDKSGGQRAEKR